MGLLSKYSFFGFPKCFKFLQQLEPFNPFFFLFPLYSAYKGTYPYLCTPFLDGTIQGDKERTHFNHCICANRASIERTYGQLKRKFATLGLGLRFKSVSKSSQFIKVCCALHNFIKRIGNILDEEDEDEVQEEIKKKKSKKSDAVNTKFGLWTPPLVWNPARATNEKLFRMYFKK